ncbi:MAG: hypothetical protein ACXQS3_03105 [Candidatus Methanofastidiosia archaeon]
MRWDKVNKDAYYKAREYEFIAKRYEKVGEIKKAIEYWENYSKLKIKKGSYFLAAYGYCHTSRLLASIGKYGKSADLMQKARNYSEKTDIPTSLFFSYELAFKFEMDGALKDALECYEDIGFLQEKLGNYFLAADAFEHAAELRYALGKPTKEYELPQKAWSKNSQYWDDKGEKDDAKWSKERKRFYNTLYRE